MSEKTSKSKRQILDAAAECFMTLGADVASIDDIAHSLGSTKGRIYHHFASKGALVNAVRLRATMITFDAVSPVIDDAKSPTDNFRAMAYSHVLAVLGSLRYHKVVLQYHGARRTKPIATPERSSVEKVHALRKEYENLFRGVLDAGMRAGEFKDQNLSVALHSVLIFMNSPVFWYMPRKGEPETTHHDIATQLADMALAALC